MAEPSTHFGERSADGWQVVDGVLDELDRLAAQKLSDHQFYAELAQRLAAIGCSASAVWMLSSAGNPTLEWRSPALESGNGEIASKSQLKTVMEAIESDEPKLVEVKLAEG